jgi:hypothetical protein
LARGNGIKVRPSVAHGRNEATAGYIRVVLCWMPAAGHQGTETRPRAVISFCGTAKSGVGSRQSHAIGVVAMPAVTGVRAGHDGDWSQFSQFR